MLDEILSLPNGARFYKCDLHTHTPVDKRFNCEGWPIQTDEQKRAFAYELVRHAHQVRGLEILAVTDHNDVSWLPYVQEAAEEEAGIIVFPGVELGSLAGQKTIHDFESRVRLKGERREERYPRLVGVAIEGGFLQGEEGSPLLLHLNPNLNAVIGGRGVGKSALLEAIRYAFDVPTKTGANQKQAGELLRNTLGAGARVTIFYETDDGTTYRIERTWGHEPRVFDAQTGAEKQGLHPSRLVSDGPIDVYGQKEIYEISKDPAFQLRLLDNYVAEALRSIHERERELARHLESNAQDILHVEQDVEEAAEKLQDLPAVQEELARLEQQEAVARLERKKQLEQEKAMLEGAGEAVEELASESEAFAARYGIPPDLLSEQARAGLPHADLLAGQRTLLNEVEAAFRRAMDDLPARLRAIWAKGEADRTTWQKEYKQEEDVYQALLREVPDASAERYIELQRRRNALEQLEREVERRRKRVTEMKAERKEMLEALRRLRRGEAFQIRHEKAQELDILLGEAITVDVLLEGNRDAYADRFDDRLEVYSPGRLPNGVTLDNIRAHFSRPRNEIIARALLNLGYVNVLGSGIPRMIRLMREHSGREPDFELRDELFLVRLRGCTGIEPPRAS